MKNFTWDHVDSAVAFFKANPDRLNMAHVSRIYDGCGCLAGFLIYGDKVGLKEYTCEDFQTYFGVVSKELNAPGPQDVFYLHEWPKKFHYAYRNGQKIEALEAAVKYFKDKYGELS